MTKSVLLASKGPGPPKQPRLRTKTKLLAASPPGAGFLSPIENKEQKQARLLKTRVFRPPVVFEPGTLQSKPTYIKLLFTTSFQVAWVILRFVIFRGYLLLMARAVTLENEGATP